MGSSESVPPECGGGTAHKAETLADRLFHRQRPVATSSTTSGVVLRNGSWGVDRGGGCGWWVFQPTSCWVLKKQAPRGSRAWSPFFVGVEGGSATVGRVFSGRPCLTTHTAVLRSRKVFRGWFGGWLWGFGFVCCLRIVQWTRASLWSSCQGQMVDALAPGADEGRGRPR